MKKGIFFLAVITLESGYGAQGQDYIITWESDTIACKLPGDAKKFGLKPTWKFEDGYEKIITVFDNDSIRILKAGEIKGYKRQEHGKGLLCDGVFEAKQIVYTGQKKRTDNEGNRPDKSPQWQFLNRIVDGKYASLYILYTSEGTNVSSSYYIERHGIEEVNTVIPFYTKRKLIALLSDSDIGSDLKTFTYKKSNKEKAEIVNQYNRLKEAAVKKIQP